MKKTALEILDETVKYYSEDLKRRAIDNGSCSYHTKDNRQCGVGRCLIDSSEFQELVKSYLNNSGIIYLTDRKVFNDSLFKEEYRGHPIQFWSQIQALHDYDFNWDDNGLTETGQVRYSLIKNQFCTEKQ